ncbi:MAG TPA: EVE domain-containing protein [bacterium]|nr:EVE domain-containing protein [bacterium]
MAKRYWLMKTEPETYSIQDLERDGSTMWEGVRNFQARNLLRDEIQKGDLVLFYHSVAKEKGVVGVAKVAKGGYPDPVAFDKRAKYYDPKSKRDDPTWYVVDVEHVETFPRVVTLAELKDTKELAGMMVTRRGARLSVQPVEKEHFEVVRKLGRKKA